MYFSEIDAERVRLGIEARRLCKAAGVHAGQYSKYRKGKNKPGEQALKRLEAALRALSKDAPASQEGKA